VGEQATPDHSLGSRDPESRNFKNFWMPVFTGMTIKAAHIFSANF
jgi:hypothetical protein